MGLRNMDHFLVRGLSLYDMLRRNRYHYRVLLL